jgi:hypothetical protein
MQTETQTNEAIELQQETGIISEVIMEFSENNEINEGMCSCVCINDESCCGCLLQ